MAEYAVRNNRLSRDWNRLIRQIFSSLLCLLIGAETTGLTAYAEAASLQADTAIAQAREQASTLLQSGKSKEAYALYMKLLREEPTDPIINMGLAKAAEAVGEHNQAVLALERLVDAFPQDAGLRMELARAHLRVGNTESARAEFEYAKTIDPALSAEIAEQVLSRLESEYRRWQISGRVSAGVVYDSNVNMGPQSAFLQLGPWNLELDSAATSQSSWGGYGMAALDGGWRAAPDSAWWVVGDVGLYRKGYFSSISSSREMAWGRAALGIRHLGASSLFDLRMKTEQADYVSDNQAVSTNGPELLYIWGITPNIQLMTRAALERRDYQENNGRQGWYLWVGEYLRILFGERGHDITIGGRWLYASTKVDDYSSQGWEASLYTTCYMPFSLELSPFIVFRQEDYNGPATALELKKRKDDNLRVGVALRHTLTEKLSCDLTWQYSDNRSTSPLYTYTQHMLSMGMTWRF